MITVTQLTAALGLIGTIGGGAYFLDARYARVEQVGANSQQIALIRIENAAASGNVTLLRRLCDDFRQTHGWTPSACKR
jgi:hypothetical protein